MLRLLGDDPYTVTMYDVLEDEFNVSIILSKLGKLTLDEVVGSFRKNLPHGARSSHDR